MKHLFCAVAAVGALGLAAQARADGPITAKYYSNYQELYGLGILYDTGSLFATDHISSINEFSNPDPSPGNSDPDFPSANLNFASDFISDITVAATGNYSFSFTTDDGGYFLLDGALAASEPGNHLPATGDATVSLTAGVHQLELQEDNAGGPCCAEALVNLPTGVVYGDPAVSAAPEPSVWALLIAGVAMVGAALRSGRKRRLGTSLAAA